MRTKLFQATVMVMLAGFALTLTSCGIRNASKGDAPDWFLNPPKSETVIYGVGASEQTQSIQLAKQIADANARTDLAMKIQVSVQAMVRTFLQQSGTLDTTRSLQFAETVSKQVVDVKLTGVTINKSEVKGGRCFSQAEVSMDTMKNALLSAVRDAAADYSEVKARQALQDLEKEISSKPSIPIIEQ